MIEIASDDLRENDPMRAAYHAKLTRGLLLMRVLSF